MVFFHPNTATMMRYDRAALWLLWPLLRLDGLLVILLYRHSEAWRTGRPPAGGCLEAAQGMYVCGHVVI